MASFGAKYPHFSKIKTEPDDALPTYEGPVNIGRLVKADLTVNLASGKLYADDELAESVDEFSSGSVENSCTASSCLSLASVFFTSSSAETKSCMALKDGSFPGSVPSAALASLSPNL